MLSKIFATTILIVLLEIALIIWIGRFLGVLSTLLLILGTAIVGVYLAKIAGLHLMAKVKAHIAQNTVPENALLDGLLIFLGGFLFLLPGFLTDIFALIIIIPWTRPMIRNVIKKQWGKKVKQKAAYIEIHQLK